MDTRASAPRRYPRLVTPRLRSALRGHRRQAQRTAASRSASPGPGRPIPEGAPGTVAGAPRSEADLMKVHNPTDIIVRIDTTTICGTDLHILKGDVPAVEPGRILGHEGVGEITQVDSSVTQLAPGDNVIISCIKSCGSAASVRRATSRTVWVTRARRDRLGVRPPDRRDPGRVRARAVRRDLRVQGARGRHEPAGRDAQRHPPDRIRDRRAACRPSAGRAGSRRRPAGASPRGPRRWRRTGARTRCVPHRREARRRPTPRTAGYARAWSG